MLVFDRPVALGARMRLPERRGTLAALAAGTAVVVGGAIYLGPRRIDASSTGSTGVKGHLDQSVSGSVRGPCAEVLSACRGVQRSHNSRPAHEPGTHAVTYPS